MTMTVEARMLFPEGGTECPPDQKPLPGSSTALPSTSSNVCLKGAYNNIPSNDCPQKSTNVGNKKRKLALFDGKQKRRIRAATNIMDGANKGCEISETPNYDTVGSNITAISNEIEDYVESTNITAAMEPLVKKGEEDGKSNVNTKAKTGAGEAMAMREEAQRKSRRLRMKRDRAEFEEIFGPKERPRYVEDLTNIDFNDDKVKIMFMDALGMCHVPKKAKVGENTTDIEFKVPLPVKTSKPKAKKNAKKNGSETCVQREDIDIQASTSVLAKRLDDEVAVEAVGASGVDEVKLPKNEVQTVSETQMDMNERQTVGDKDDEEGWECWLTRLSTTYTIKPENKLPTAEEIHESLIRLVRLGTHVKIVVS